jgi:hypothetical protein
MDPVGFDAGGNLFVRGPSETPRWGPGVVPDPVRDGDSGSLPLTVNKMRAMNAKSAFSSQRPGRDAAYATDNSTGTWWEPAEDDRQPSITVDLGPATEFDPIQMFTVDSSRILFVAGRGFGRPGAPPPPPPEGAPAHRYRIEASGDGRAFTTLVDKTQNTVTRYVEFDELPPTTCRLVRLTLTDWPRVTGTPLGILEFTVFGKAVSPSAPPASGNSTGVYPQTAMSSASSRGGAPTGCWISPATSPAFGTRRRSETVIEADLAGNLPRGSRRARRPELGSHSFR